MMDYRNAKFVAETAIEMEINHPVFGWIPFTATLDDPEEHGRLLFVEARDTALPYPATTPQAVDPLSLPMERLDFWLAAASVGVSKFSVRAHIEAMPEGIEKCEAIAWFEEAKQYRRQDPLLIALAAAEGITEPQLDALWVWSNPAT